MKKIITNNYVRISKKQAAARYKTDQNIYLLPCKMHPENLWQNPMLFNRKGSEHNTFDQIVNSFEYYNCDYERGYYAAFYITRKEYEERMNNF